MVVVWIMQNITGILNDERIMRLKYMFSERGKEVLTFSR